MKMKMRANHSVNGTSKTHKKTHVHAKSIKLPSFLIHRDRPWLFCFDVSSNYSVLTQNLGLIFTKIDSRTDFQTNLIEF